MSDHAQRILVVEDERSIAGILRDYLLRAGFRVTQVGDGQAALRAVAEEEPDLILLDLMLPGVDGLTVCREVRQRSAVPIIMATARVEEIDRLLGMELGADDYVCKPFSPREVVARVKAVLRRVQPVARESREGGGGATIEIDKGAQRASVGGQRLDLTPTEFRLLRLLVSHPGRIYSRAQILELAYDDDQDVSDRVVDSHIKNLRRKIARLAPDQEVIHSVYGMGYRYEVEGR